MTSTAPGSRERVRIELAPRLAGPNAVGELEAYLLARSGLPGPRANLELAAAFADEIASRGLGPVEWGIIRRWVALPVDAPDAREVYLAVCALQALGAAYPRASAETQREALATLRSSAVDSRWRVRESVAIGLQMLGEADLAAFTGIMEDWSRDPSPLVRRTVLAALAHPPILRDRGAALMALGLTAGIFDTFAAIAPVGRRAEEVQVLKRALEYAPSVIVAALPDLGFEWLRRLAGSEDPAVRKIVRTNLGKARLAARFPGRVAEVIACLTR